MDTSKLAFPRPLSVDPGGQTAWDSAGMTLREYYAGLVLQGLLADSEFNAPPEFAPEFAARTAVQYADALLVALAKPKAEGN